MVQDRVYCNRHSISGQLEEKLAMYRLGRWNMRSPAALTLARYEQLVWDAGQITLD